MKRTILTTMMVIGCFIACFAAIVDFSGKWEGKLQTETGEVYPLLYNFKIEGDHLTGTAKTPKGDMPIQDGKITGTEFTFIVNIGDIEIPHTGKFYGDSIAVDISANGEKAHTVLVRCAP